MSSKIRKGGKTRYVISNALIGDSFIVPTGNRIYNMYTENVSAPQVQTAAVVGTSGANASAFTITPAGGSAADFFTGAGANVPLSGDTPAVLIGKLLNNTTAIAVLKKQGWSLAGNTTTGTLYLFGTFPGTAAQGANVFAISGTTTQTVAGGVGGGSASIATVPTVSLSSTPLVVGYQTLTLTGTVTSAVFTVFTIAGVLFAGAGFVQGDSIATTITRLLSYTPGLQALNAIGMNLTGNANTGVLTLTSLYARVFAAQAVSVTGGTGITVPGTFTQVVAGVAASADLYPATALLAQTRQIQDGSATLVTTNGKNFTPAFNVTTYTFTFATTSTSAGTMYVNGNPLNIATGQTPTQIAQTVLSSMVLGFIDSATAGAITFTQNAPGAGFDIPIISMGTVGGTTVSLTATTPHDTTYYVNIVPTATFPVSGIGQYNIYLLLEKFN